MKRHLWTDEVYIYKLSQIDEGAVEIPISEEEVREYERIMAEFERMQGLLSARYRQARKHR